MQRIASAAVVSLLAVSLVGGCSLFGKKADNKATDAYDPNYGAAPQETYPTTYQPLASDYSGSTGAAGTRYHTVQKKDTLYSIARQYYGDQARWKDIYNANRAEISDPNKIRVGQRLAIP